MLKEVKNEDMKLSQLYATTTTSLDLVDEKLELYETVNETQEEDKDKMILDLQQKIYSLEKLNKDLLEKNEGLTKNNIMNNNVLTKMSLVGQRRKFTSSQANLNSNAQDDNIKLAEIIKEKDDLQEMNEKMLDLLTEKELENEDLLQKLENYKLEAKIENEKNIEKIQSLEEKIEKLENSKGNEFDIDDIVNEYNNYKERLKGQINEYLRNEENYKQDIDIKERTIQKLKEEIQGLEMENLQLVSQSESKEKITQNERIELDQLKSENEIFNQLILLNKTSIKKKQVEFLAVFRPKFRENQYFEDVFDRVTKKYGIIVNKKSLNKKGHFSINFELKYKTVIQNFSYKSSYEIFIYEVLFELKLIGSSQSLYFLCPT